MSVPLLRINGRERARDTLLHKIDSGAARCGVIGLGFIGSVLMDALIANGIEAVGFDRAQSAVERFDRHGVVRHAGAKRPFQVTNAAEEIAACDVVFVAVRNPVEGGAVDEEPLRAAAQLLKDQTGRPRLIVLESTVMPGTTRRFAAELQAHADEELFLVHAPERLSAGHGDADLRAIPHLVAGLDAASVELGAALLRKLCDTVIPVSSPEVSELSKLLENAFLSVNIGLAAEVTRLSLSLGIRATEVCDAAATKPFGFMPFHPGAGLGGHCLPNDLAMFAEASRARGLQPCLLEGAISANDSAPGMVIERLAGLLALHSKSLTGSSVVIVGVGFKPGSADTTRSPAFDLVRRLRERGAGVHYIDARVASFAVDGEPVPVHAGTALQRHEFDAAILAAGDGTVAVETLLAAVSVVLDAGGSRKNLPAVPGLETL